MNNNPNESLTEEKQAFSKDAKELIEILKVDKSPRDEDDVPFLNDVVTTFQRTMQDEDFAKNLTPKHYNAFLELEIADKQHLLEHLGDIHYPQPELESRTEREVVILKKVLNGTNLDKVFYCNKEMELYMKLIEMEFTNVNNAEENEETKRLSKSMLTMRLKQIRGWSILSETLLSAED